LPLERALTRAGRWLYFLSFKKEKLGETVKEIYQLADEDNYIYTTERTRLLEAIRGWKSKTLGLMKVSGIDSYVENRSKLTA
jgi:hypothetical protein